LISCDRRLTGDIDVRCLLGPTLSAVLVDRDDFADATDAILGLCQTWAGACFRMYAVEHGAESLPPELFEDQRSAIAPLELSADGVD
jgi:hypothetical protein